MPEAFDIRKPLRGQKKLTICGHRGDRTSPEENTLAAFRRMEKEFSAEYAILTPLSVCGKIQS